MLSVKSLEVVYDDSIVALRGVTLDVPRGSIVALLGANGAGKSTVMRAIGGLLHDHDGKITKGGVELNGRSLTRLTSAQVVALGVGQVLEGRPMFVDLTVDENLRVGGFTCPKGAFAEQLVRVYDLFPQLAARRRVRTGHLSGGEQQMVAIGRALMHSPELMLLDEPSLGLAPKFVEKVGEVVVEINRQGTSVLLVEQNAHLALSVAHYGYVLEEGRVVLDNTASVLRNDAEIQASYLGIGDGGGRRSFADVKHYRRRKRWLS